MNKFEKEIVVTEAEWKSVLDAYQARVLKDLEAVDLQDEPFEVFFKTGDMAKFLDDCIAEGSNPERGWLYVFKCNPNRDFELLKRNIKIYWDRVLENVDVYFKNHRVMAGKDRKTSIFVRRMNYLGTVNSPVLDPVCAAKLFLWAYGEEYAPVRSFPMSFGPSEWTPQIEVNPVERFTDMISLIGTYLFYRADIRYRQSLALVDYWFSIFPHLTDLRIFDIEMHEDQDIDYPRRQCVVRAFLANLAGYDVYGEYDELPHNDPELEQYIKNRLAETAMPEPYYRLLEYIEEHKENSCDNLEEDD